MQPAHSTAQLFAQPIAQSMSSASLPGIAADHTVAATGAEIVVRSLERHGVRIVAGIPGGAVLPLYEALARCSRITHVLARHEQAAGFIAQGLARMTQRAGVCIATSGPGVTNMITALADAKHDSIPLVCIVGQVPQHLIGTDAFQEVATLDLARPVTKAVFAVQRAEDLDEILSEAFHCAESGRPGPVLIDIPKDVQLARACKAAPKARERERLPKCDAQFEIAMQLIANAQRPILYVGGGVVKARAEHLLRRFAEHTSIPVASTLMALGVLPHDHPLNLGMLGMHGARFTHHAIDACDLLIAIGARFDDRATGDPKRFAPHAKIIHIDIDAREFGKIKAASIALHADAWQALTQLLRMPKQTRRDWLAEVAQLCMRHPNRSSEDAAHPHQVLRMLADLLPRDTIVTTDVGQHQMWVAQAYPFTRADRWLTSGGLGTMGFGLPAAIGAAIAEPDATVACFTGDGSLLMNIQELATLAELNLNVKIIVFDNASLGLVRQQQQLFYGQRYYAARYDKACDFVAIASAFGIAALEFSGASVDKLRELLTQPGPALIRVPIEANHNVSPMVASGSANVEALDC